MREYVEDCLKLTLKDRDALDVPWDKQEGRDLVQKLYQEAYSAIASRS
jgi:hypothetical protein